MRNLALMWVLAMALVVGAFFVVRYERKAERLFDTGKAYYEENNYDSAITYFAAAAERKPLIAKYHYWRGRAFHQKKDYAEAIAAYTEAIRLEPDNAKAYAYRGGAYCDRLEEGDNANALMNFYKSIDLNPDYAVKLPEISGPLKIPEVEKPNYDDKNKLYLRVVITDSCLNLGAKGGFMSEMFLRESRRYVTKGGLDTVIDYSNDRRPVNQRTGKAFTEDELVAVYLYGGYLPNRLSAYLGYLIGICHTDEERKEIPRVMYTKSGEMLMGADSNRLDRVRAGDTVYALANPRRMIIVSDTNEFESKFLSVFDEHLRRLMRVKEIYRDNVDDADDIVIFREDGVAPDKIMKLIYAARIAGYPNINVVSLDSNNAYFQWRSDDSARLQQIKKECKEKWAAATDTYSLTDKTPRIPFAVFTDSRDGKVYRIVKIGGQYWFAENLNYAAEGSKCYDNRFENCMKYGSLYDWETAKKACPDGTHLPTDMEWSALVEDVGGWKTAGEKLKSTAGWNNNGNGTDNYGFSALPGGSGHIIGRFSYIGNNGRWWSATEGDADNPAWVWTLYMDYNTKYMYKDDGTKKTNQLSVRCVLDD